MATIKETHLRDQPKGINIPTKPGMYWYRLLAGSGWRSQEVIRYDDHASMRPELKGRLVVYNGEGPVPIERLHREWREQTQRPK